MSKSFLLNLFQAAAMLWPVLVWCAGNARAQDPGALQPVSEINRLLTDPANTAPRQMRFSGSVIFISRAGDLCVQDGNAGIIIEPPADQPRPRPGDKVEVTASISYHSADLLDPDFFLQASAIQILGPGELPPPEPVSLGTALLGGAAGRRVQVEGAVMQATVQNGVVQLHLTDTSGWAVVNVHDWRSGTTTQGWWGARLRITAANIGRGHSALRVTSSDDITLVAPGTAEWFSAPDADITAMRKNGTTFDRLRVTGTVLEASPEEIYLRSDAGVPLRTSLLGTFPPTQPQPHPLELLAPRRPQDLKPGDRVELVGSAHSVSPFWQMNFSSVRPLASGSLPAPVDTAGRNPSDFACDLITLPARVRWLDAPAGKLELESAGVNVTATLPTTGEAPEPWEAGDLVRATGLLKPAESDRWATLILTGPSALERLSPTPSGWRALSPLAQKWFAGLLAVLGVALAGTWWLQRLVRQRTAALAAANDALKEEVAVRVKAESDLARALQQERELSELKTGFVNTVSHEFRTPLGITMSAVELLQHYDDRLPPEQKTELLADIQRSTKSMAGLMDEVLLLGRAEAGRLSFRPAPLDLGGRALKLTDEQHSATSRKCPIEWTAENDLRGAHADEALLRHILTNLLSNGVKYSPAGTPVHFSARREGPLAIFTIRDTGIGIPEEDLPHLFEAFHRAGNVGEISGTGLGLVISKRCAELHGGSIAVKSAPGEGSAFTVSIPAWSAGE